ncbi:GUN4 domain-containing protein [Komarekiella delphini-convector]|nr:GUN4 domain-containing protein [Komarekiella delphini-convector]
MGKWQVMELRSLIGKLVEADIPVIPVLLPGVKEIPHNLDFLKQLNWVSFSNGLDDNEALDHLVWGITQEKPITEVQADDLSSEKGVNYRRLRDLLAAGKWQEADTETFTVMFQASGREKERCLDRESIKNFPSTDLRTIDQLWVKYSNGRFGFSVQKKIYLSVGGKADGKYHEEAEDRFCDRVGWKVQGSWINYPEEVSFNTSAPEGHLPDGGVCWLWGWSGLRGVLLSRRDL